MVKGAKKMSILDDIGKNTDKEIAKLKAQTEQKIAQNKAAEQQQSAS